MGSLLELKILTQKGLNPSKIATKNLAAWFDSSTFSTVTKDGGDLLAQLNNKASSAVGDAIQATGASKPLWVDNGMNGRDTALYDGTDYMTVAGLTGILSEANDWEVSVTFKLATATPDQVIFSSTAGASDRMTISINANGFLTCGIYDGAWTAKSVEFHNTETQHVVTMSRKAGVTTAYVNGDELILTAETPTAITTVDTVIGARTDGTLPLDGYISEIIVYNKALGFSERAQVLNYLKGKWNTGINTLADIQGGILWLNAQDTSSLIKSGSEEVSSWADGFAGSTAFVNVVTSQQPIYTLNKINGKPAVVFNGSSNELKEPGVVTAAMSAVNGATGSTIMMVSATSDISHAHTPLVNIGAVFLKIHLPWISLAVFYDFGASVSPGRVSAPWGGTVNVPNIWTFETDGTTHQRVMRDETIVVTAGTSLLPNVAVGAEVMSLGGNANRFEGDMGEIAIWNRRLSGYEHDRAYAIKYKRWGF